MTCVTLQRHHIRLHPIACIGFELLWPERKSKTIWMRAVIHAHEQGHSKKNNLFALINLTSRRGIRRWCVNARVKWPNWWSQMVGRSVVTKTMHSTAAKRTSKKLKEMIRSFYIKHQLKCKCQNPRPTSLPIPPLRPLANMRFHN